jgi:hypothetical protein
MKHDSFEYKGYQVTIDTDDDPVNPRTEFDNLGKMICFHNRYSLGDDHNYKFPSDFIYDLAVDYSNAEIVENDEIELTPASFVEKYLDKLEKHLIILPIYLYNHSGLTINTTGFSCHWDSGQVGWIYITKKQVRKEWNVKGISPKLKKKIEDILIGEVETYDQYLRGEVYGFRIKDEDGEEIDSCWGYFGDPEDGMIPEIKAQIDWHAPIQEEIMAKQLNFSENVMSA